MKKLSISQIIVLSINVLLICGIFVGNWFYLEGPFNYELKKLLSSAFALIGSINLVYALIAGRSHIAFSISMSVGLILAMSGDIAINKDFIIGAGLFMLGHICFIVGYCFLEKMKWLDYIISFSVFAFAAAFLLFWPKLDFSENPVFRYVCLIYALVISLMLGKSAGNFIRQRSFARCVILAGSVLFVFSDLMLVFDWFMGMGRTAGILCMSTYYPAECLLALSIFLITLEYKKKA